MQLPLADNAGHVELLCSRLGLGRPQQGLGRVFGGFHHRMWRLDTERGRYAIKQLAPDTDLDDPATEAHYNRTERIATEFSRRGIAAIHALNWRSRYLQCIDGEAYLVYPWTDAEPLPPGRVARSRTLSVARLLARMHGADIAVPGSTDSQRTAIDADQVGQLIGVARQQRLAIAPSLAEHRRLLEGIGRLHGRALSTLARRQVISHGDLDQKNVLWDAAGNPVLIDWESAGNLNPTFEVMMEALDWSGISSHFDRGLFACFLSTYVAAGGVIEKEAVEAAVYGILGDWLDWLMYNLGRTVNMDDAGQRAAGEEQMHIVLPTILRLGRLLPEVLHTARTTVAGLAARGLPCSI